MVELLLSKGQIFTADFMASIGLFTVMLVMFGSIWNTSVDTYSPEVDTQRNQHKYSFNLLQTSGHPSNWNSTNIEIPGIYENGYISGKKFLELKNLSKNKKNNVFNVKNFQIKVRNLNGTLKTINGTDLKTNSTENSELPESKTIHTSKKYALLKETNERVKLRYNTWR